MTQTKEVKPFDLDRMVQMPLDNGGKVYFFPNDFINFRVENPKGNTLTLHLRLTEQTSDVVRGVVGTPEDLQDKMCVAVKNFAEAMARKLASVREKIPLFRVEEEDSDMNFN